MTKTLQSNQQSEVDAESVPSSLRIVCDDASSINLQAAEAAEEGKPALRKFSMVAYTGGAMRLGGWPYPVVVDLAGMRVTRKSRPILKDHDRASIVGHTDDIMVGDSRLEVAGVISGVGNTAQEVIATSENGFPWQASLGANADKVVFIPEGKTATANSREFKGPVYIARKSTLGEVSFVALGADDDTEARIAAGQAEGDDDLDGNEPDEDNTESDDSELDPVNASLDLGGKPKRPVTSGVVSKMRIEAAAESKRIAGIRKVCAGKHTEIEARAIEEGWSVTKTELAVLRIERPKAPDQQASQPMYRREGPWRQLVVCRLDSTKRNCSRPMESERLMLPIHFGTLACENLSLNARDWRATTFRAYSATVLQRFALASRRCRFLASSRTS